MTTDVFLADCRARLAFDLLSNTWNAVVLWALRDAPLRPVELRERIGGISSKVLTQTLRRLQFNGLVAREVHPGAPPRVVYELTGLGRTLLEPIDAVGAWAFEHGDAVMAAQEAAQEAVQEAAQEPTDDPAF
ncbi:winged helix-turn-helix transcriptional regulator [Streptomyces sp. NPDC050085]|uniref:winged helix-turn-helix transcriptional regulator n=1 Tax=Streptomyces sp. NPDC050085 TaxID=3365600 RepID=UPI0037A4C3FD